MTMIGAGILIPTVYLMIAGKGFLALSNSALDRYLIVSEFSTLLIMLGVAVLVFGWMRKRRKERKENKEC